MKTSEARSSRQQPVSLKKFLKRHIIVPTRHTYPMSNPWPATIQNLNLLKAVPENCIQTSYLKRHWRRDLTAQSGTQCLRRRLVHKLKRNTTDKCRNLGVVRTCSVHPHIRPPSVHQNHLPSPHQNKYPKFALLPQSRPLELQVANAVILIVILLSWMLKIIVLNLTNVAGISVYIKFKDDTIDTLTLFQTGLLSIFP